MSGTSTTETRHDEPSPEGLPEGTRLVGHFQLIKQLGKGAQGVVYLAEDTLLHRNVALKMLLGGAIQTPEVRERFQREAETTSRLNHPGICGVHEVGEVDGTPYIAMQYVKGKTLAGFLDESRELHGRGAGETSKAKRVNVGASVTLNGGSTLQDVLRVVEQAARALHVAHEAGLVHRDIKPANIMVTEKGEPVLLDFGLARDLDSTTATLTQSGQIVGTPAYLAPEQFRGGRKAVDRRTDVYALGVTLYECLTLQRPFESDTFEELFQKILTEIPADPRKFNPRIPLDLRTVIETAMERDPQRRYPTALEFAEDLRRVRTFEPIHAKPAGIWIRSRKWLRRNPAPGVAIGSTTLFVVIVGGIFVGDWISRRSSVRANLGAAEASLAEGRLDAATDALTRAEARDPDYARISGLDSLRARIEGAQQHAAQDAKKADDTTKAAAARKESLGAQEKHAQIAASVSALRASVGRERSNVFARYSSPEDRAAYAKRELELATREAEAKRLLQEAEEGLQHAARFEAPWGGMTKETEAAFAAFYFM